MKSGDRVYVDDPGLAQLRAIMKRAIGQEPRPNHHGTIESIQGEEAIILFDDTQSVAPYPFSQIHLLVTEPKEPSPFRESRPMSETYWNGEPTPAFLVRVKVLDGGRFPKAWFKSFVGQVREAVEVHHPSEPGHVFYLDNENGSGWRKVTEGRGSPSFPHREFDLVEVMPPERGEDE